MKTFNSFVGDITPGSYVIQYGGTDRSVWRKGEVIKVAGDIATVQFHDQSDGLSWLGHSPMPIAISKLEVLENADTIEVAEAA